MEQAVVVEGGILTGEKIKIKNKSENSGGNSPVKSIRNKAENSPKNSPETHLENTESSNAVKQQQAVKRRHSAGKIRFIF